MAGPAARSWADRIPTMSIEELMGLLEDRTTTLTPEEFRLVKDHCERYTLLASLQGAKRKMDAPEDGAPAPKRREFKYTNIEKLTIGASLRKFTDWKADMERLFQGNTEKFGTDSMKLIAAHQYMDTKAKTLWQTHIHTNPGDDRWGPFLQWAQQMVTQGANFEITTYQEHHNAKQRPSQSPVRFDAYLSALESVMGRARKYRQRHGFLYPPHKWAASPNGTLRTRAIPDHPTRDGGLRSANLARDGTDGRSQNGQRKS